MKKIGIITISGNYNYGNRLQNYAMQEAYKKLGFEVETIWNTIAQNPEYKIPLFVKFKNIIKPLFGKINYDKIRIERTQNFVNFTNSYINNSSYIINNDNDNNTLNDMYDYFSVGSDQVWNYTFNIMSQIEFLNFADRDKTIAYAPSFGISMIPKIMEDTYISGLNHIKHLSVREDAGAKIIKNLTGRDAKVVLDPTMLLFKEDYEKIEKKPKADLSQKYILLYFLGNINEKRKKEIEHLSQKYNLDVINITDISDKCHTAGPDEFLYLFHHAELVLTDSFHACVFSVIYNKSFYVYDRDQVMSNMNSRLETFLGLLNLQNRKIHSLSDIDNPFEKNYDEANIIIADKREESYDYLRNSLNINNA